MAATSLASENTVDGQAASIGSSDAQVGNWDGGTFHGGGLAVQHGPDYS